MNRQTRNHPATVIRIFVTLLALTAAPVLAGQPAETPRAAETAFENLKGLAGHWQGTSQTGKRVAIDYEVVADGTAVVERFGFLGDEGPGQDTPADDVMLTVYHLDGESLMLTHYCMSGNQPTMRADAIDGDEVRFELSGITNLSSPETGHMHRAVVRFQGPDRLTTAWTYREGGEDRFTEVIEAERVARTAARSN